ncbi:exopolysaccharide production repressor protein [Mesorhizobium sp.]|uniref:exopolysaccharide production repressor protein n=1 Tax=Mesorhizobium sp. TaxID=1871066 RepID=UPI000FE638E9|nr:exopolysaccharide production repressor protein [Mesorhizobium sp.]RWA67049.1 MAG: exopolysaccharide repressor protein [Mesorhizobium sp.]TIM05418.1 MAG: exopolysaccharide repressor protein [Mesorhizobium sp.]TIS78139.1 MAG: exopolysaccharide repressor protein [Mesorhizobium sp.]TIV73347.1 MAG: exopolysaccharide repressor protein [Mesorhizobium sp.]
MHFTSFCRLLGLVLCSNALIVYVALDSLRLAVVTTLACSLLLQACYFGSVLFLIWQSSRARGTRLSRQHVDGSRKAWYQSSESDQLRNEISAVSRLGRMPSMRCCFDARMTGSVLRPTPILVTL